MDTARQCRCRVIVGRGLREFTMNFIQFKICNCEIFYFALALNSFIDYTLYELHTDEGAFNGSPMQWRRTAGRVKLD